MSMDIVPVNQKFIPIVEMIEGKLLIDGVEFSLDPTADIYKLAVKNEGGDMWLEMHFRQYVGRSKERTMTIKDYATEIMNAMGGIPCANTCATGAKK